MAKEKRHDKERREGGTEPVKTEGNRPPAMFSGDEGTPAGGEQARGGDTIIHPGTSAGDLVRPADRGHRLEGSPDAEGREIERNAMDGAPGIPAGEGGEDLDDVLQTPDSDLGGVVAADTTPTGDTEDRPDEQQVRREDKERNTL